MRSEGYCSWVCVCVCVSVKSDLTSGGSVCPENSVTHSTGNEGQKIYGVFSETASFKSYGVICLPVTSYKGIAASFRTLFSTAEPSKGPKKANNKLNTTWNTTLCKAASFFLFILRLLAKIFLILPVTRYLE